MPDFGLQVAIADTVKELLGDTLEHRKSTSAAITPDGRVSPAAVAGALPWQAHDGKIEGTVTTGSNRLRWHFPQGGVIRQVSYDVRTAPSGGSLQFTLSGGNSTESFGLQAGQASGVTNTGIRMAAGSWARLNVTAANGAADLAVTLQYESLGAGSTASGGSGGGGGGGTISVISVNGQTGVVVLDADDIDDTTTTHKFMSAAEKAKLASFEPGDYVLASSLALVATSGNYEDLSNKPTLGTAAAMNASAFASATQGAKADTAVQPGDLADVATSGDYEDLDNKPTIPAQFNPIAGTNMSITGTYPDITFNASGGGGGGGAVDSVNGQTGTVVLDAGDIDATASRLWLAPAERTKLDGIEAGAQVNVTPTWGAVTGKPSAFPPSPHDHDDRYYTETEVNAIIAALAIPQTKGNPAPGSTSISMDSAGTTVLTDGHVLTFSGLITGRTYEVTWVISARNGSGGSGAYRITAEVIGNSTSMPTYGAFAHGGNLESTTGTGRTTMVPNSSGVITVAPAITRESGATRISQVNIVATVS